MLENYNSNEQKFNRHDVLINFSLTIWYIDFVMTMYILNVHARLIEFIIWQWNEGLLCYTSVKARY